MHYGTVNSIDGDLLEAVVTLEVARENDNAELIEFVVDTGFDGQVTLPLNIISRLNLPGITGAVEVTVADGSIDHFDRYIAYIRWHGQLSPVRALNMECAPLIGMELLRDSNISIDAVPGGAVTIAELAAA